MSVTLRYQRKPLTRISEARLKAGLSQAKTAAHLGITHVTYGKLEKNPDLLTVRDGKKLAELFNVDIDSLFFD